MCSACLIGLFLSLLDSHFGNMLTGAPRLILTLAFLKQSKFLVTSCAAAQHYRICILCVMWNVAVVSIGYLIYG